MQALKEYIGSRIGISGSGGLASLWIGAVVIAIVPGAGILWLIWCFLRTRNIAGSR